MMNGKDYLFSTYDLDDVLRSNTNKAKDFVNSISEEQFKSSTDEQVIEHVHAEHEVLPLEIFEDRMTMDTQETEIDVRHDPRRAIFNSSRPCMIPATRVIVSLPYGGHRELWKCRPNTFSSCPPRASVQSNRDDSGTIRIIVEQPTDTLGDGADIKKEVHTTLNDIRTYIGRINDQVEKHNENLRAVIASAVSARRERLGKHAQLANVLDIPLKRRDGAPETEPLPIKRKLVRPLPQPGGRPPEPGIRSEDYEHILSVIRHEGRSFETTPSTFAKHDEEELRDFVLAHLNGHYEGGATGETFRNKGKTDIRIEAEDRAAFVAECKVWRGVKEVVMAVDQLLGYMTWRDCKGALVVFNKDVAGFTEIQPKLHDAIKQHGLQEAELDCPHTGEWRFRLRSAEDAGHKVTLHVFLFNLYTQNKK